MKAMNRQQNLDRLDLAAFFKAHPDAAAFFIAADLDREYVKMAIRGVVSLHVALGDKKGYAEVVRRVVAQRDRDRLERATSESPKRPGGGVAPEAPSVELVPPVMTLR